MMSNSESRKRLDESTARPESGPRACDGTPQGCIVKPCNSPVPCGGCCWCLGGCDVDPAPVAEPADGDELSRNSSALSQGDSVEPLTLEQANELVGDDIESWMENPFLTAQMRVEKVLWWLARRDEQRDREAVGRVDHLRIPTGRTRPDDGGETMNQGIDHIEVPIVIDPDMERRGEVRNGYDRPVIALREWNEQVLLHEVIHVALGWVQPPLNVVYPTEGHEVISQIEVALWETGWRLRDREARREVERVEAVLASWENSSEAARYHWTRALCADLRAALGDSTESGSR